MKYPRTIGPLTIYGWGWEIKAFGWWLVWSRADGGRHCYVSNDATPPDHLSSHPNRGMTLYRRFR